MDSQPQPFKNNPKFDMTEIARNGDLWHSDDTTTPIPRVDHDTAHSDAEHRS